MDATIALTGLTAQTCPLTVLQPYMYGLSSSPVGVEAKVGLEGNWGPVLLFQRDISTGTSSTIKHPDHGAP